MEKSNSSGNILFIIFWWLIQRLNVRWAHKLLYWGLRDGSFPTGRCTDPSLGLDLFGHHFDTPIGISDGIDKRGNILDALLQIGYSFGSFGPYTLEKELPQQDKSFFKTDRAIITQCNGYRNPGLLKMIPWFVKRRYLPHFVGVDIAIPIEQETANIKQGRHFSYQEEFTLMAQKVAPYCDFITLDLSHPSSELYLLSVNSATINPIIKSVKEIAHQAAPIQTPKIFVKIPLDLNITEIPLVAQIILDSGVDGVVVAGPISLERNARVKLEGQKSNQNVGMLSGAPTQEYVSELIRRLYAHIQNRVPIIACGGVFDGATAYAHIAAGASLVTLDEASLVYEGPMLINKINKELSEIIHKRNMQSIRQAIGFDFLALQQTSLKMPTQVAKPTTTPAAPATEPATPASSPAPATIPSSDNPATTEQQNLSSPS